MFVIWNPERREFVTPVGSARSYTQSLQSARVFPTREAAQADCCGNEIVRAVSDVMGSLRHYGGGR